MAKRLILLSSLILAIIIALIVFQFRTSYVTLEFQPDKELGDKLSGTLYLTLAPDELPKDAPIIIYLARDNQVLDAATLSVSDFLKNNNTIRIESIMNLVFSETGDYAVILHIPSIDYTARQSFVVK